MVEWYFIFSVYGFEIHKFQFPQDISNDDLYSHPTPHLTPIIRPNLARLLICGQLCNNTPKSRLWAYMSAF